ncbi:relaxase/mobilization nuclease domain-containing protein [Hymenobacter yonginensis]|uniref:Relaxase/mobilization nuclease domain-containing protein n=1 Tax=Hymenobacter yonginensis TaxID=748197 RepID=A0ABY7PV95_9BACT|nr:relaxase/mobilization nuclease domain-containing protein [Hymenobacter yonginensis]WBO86841.1 relaxase/mobilization nuclease domain-containing protein [Hymenobacter yonginensis]
MVSKTKMGSSFAGAVKYQFTGYQDAPTDKKCEVLFTQGIRDSSQENMIADFKRGSSRNLDLGLPVWHTSLGFNPADAEKLDSTKMLEVGLAWAKGMGLDKTQLLIVRHHDREDNQHLHLLASRVNFDGRTIKDGNVRMRSKELNATIEKQFGLTTSVKSSQPELQHPERVSGPDREKAEIRQALGYAERGAATLSELWTGLKERDADVEVRERRDAKGTLVGVSFSKNGRVFTGSEIGRAWSSKAIEEKLEMNREDRAAAEQQTRAASAGAKVSVPVAPPIAPKGMGPVEEAKQNPVSVPAFSQASPTPAEARGLAPTEASESAAPTTTDALVPDAGLLREQIPTAENAGKANDPARADEHGLSSPAAAPPTEFEAAPAAHVHSTSSFEEKLARWEAQQLADAEDERLAVLYYDWLQLQKQVQQQVAAATHEALSTGEGFSTLLDRQGLALLPATDDAPICVQHRASGESFSAEEVPLPSSLLTPASQASVQYGVVQMGNTDLQKAPDRLAKVREHLLEVGLTVGFIEPATAHKPAQLNWAFNPLQPEIDLTLVMAKLDAVQASRNAWILEAPHAWHPSPGKAYGRAEPQLYWDNRAGQFNEARLELHTVDQRSAGRVDRVRQAMSKRGVGLGPVQTDAQGRLSFTFRYHTLAPKIDDIDTLLIQVRNSGFDLQESEQQQRARAQGIPVVAARDAGMEYSR